MRLIAVAGVLIAGWLGMTGFAQGATLVPVAPANYFGSNPSFLTGPPNDRRVFIAERGNPGTNVAQVRIIANGSPVAAPFLTIDNVALVSERGLMSIAFSPDYTTSGLLYAFYTAAAADELDPDGQAGDIRIVEYRVSAGNPNRADPDYARLVMKIPHSAGNHNGGWMAFGPDDMLHIAVGDNANPANAQNLGNLLGKVLRIDPKDPDGAGPGSYTIPPDNPFVGDPTARDEIHAYGLRNPYRGSFLPDGRLSIGDVGQSTWEEINVGDLKGKNLGWPICEGFCVPANPLYTDPFYAYGHPGPEGGCAVVGGHVIEDPGLTGLTGLYVYGDHCRGPIRTLNLGIPGGNPQVTELDTFGNPVSIDQDSPGCSYVLTSSEVFRIAANQAAACPLPLDPGQPDPPGPPAPPVDVTYTSFIPNRAVIARILRVGARCSISCAARANATFRVTRNRIRRKPAVFRRATPAMNLAPNMRQNLQFRIPPKRVRGMRWSARNGSRVTAVVRITLTGADGSGGSSTRRVRLVRPNRR